MTIEKILNEKSKLIETIKQYIDDNHTLNIGDIVTTPGFDYNNNNVYVITGIGFHNKIVYYGNKVKKNGEVSNMSMHTDIGLSSDHFEKKEIKRNVDGVKINTNTIPLEELKYSKEYRIKL